MTDRPLIPKRVASTLINALKGGVVPRIGLPYITVGRKNEIDALLKDVELIEEGGASFRFIMGKYGSGKSFLLQTIRNYVFSKNFVVLDADLSPERRLVGNKGQGLATYRELVKNMSVKARPEGGALPLILDKWISTVMAQVSEETSLSPTDPAFSALAEKKIKQEVYSLSELVHGFDFALLLTEYYKAFALSDEDRKARVLKWFKGEYNTKTDAKKDIGINIIIGDDNWYDYLKILALFLKQAGYGGMLVLIDELVNIYKIPHATSRQYNYEKILTIYNDCLQGKAKHFGIIMGGTPLAIEDTRRGVYSYEALRSRLSSGYFSGEHKDLLAPVIPLLPLTAEEMLVLVGKLSEIHGRLYDYTPTITDRQLAVFIQTEFKRIGADSHITPREVIRDFIELLDILSQNPSLDIEQLLGSKEFKFAQNDVLEETVSNEFAEFTL